MGHTEHFLSKVQLEQIIEKFGDDPIVKAFAESTLASHGIHTSLEKLLLEALSNKETK